MDDEKLVIRAQNGDKEAFTMLIQRYKKEIYCIAKSRLMMMQFKKHYIKHMLIYAN